MKSTFKGILIGVFGSAFILLFAIIILNSRNQHNSTTLIDSNNAINVKSATPNTETSEKQINTNLKIKNNSSEEAIKLNKSLKQQEEREKIVALDRKYAQSERELSEHLLDLRQKMSNLPISLKQKLSYVSDEAELQRISSESQMEAERIQKQILETNEKLGLIRAKRELLPLNAIKGN